MKPGRRPAAGAWSVTVIVAVGFAACGGGAATPSDGGGVDTAMDTAVMPSCDGSCTIRFASSAEWIVYDGDPAQNPAAHPLGPAQAVCLNATSPPSCPSGAVLYGFGGTGWGQDLLIVPDAIWIWGPGVTGTDQADLKKFFFSKTFNLGKMPSGRITLSADDAAEVRVNGAPVDTVGSVTDQSEAAISGSTLTTFDIAPRLTPGLNTITIAAQNGPASFAGCVPSCTYKNNPAAVVFGGSLTYH
ncbi:MAG TPA: hypothetical protein VFH73_21315 [Polyangia bacterium]|jgi:hypothetical protein|nr:hypothetical protein [Polyangia bacterium]